MKSITFTLLALASAAFAQKGAGYIGNATSAGHQSGGEEYVVLFDRSKPTPPDVVEILKRIELDPSHVDVKYTFDNPAFGGFVAKMKDHCIDALNAMEEVSHVEQAVKVTSHVNQRINYPWGTQRVSSNKPIQGDAKARDYTYSYDGDKPGDGVDVYIVDTGVRVTHKVFEGRAKNGFSYEESHEDGDGHGTHCAGTATGDFFGISSNANVFGVKVLNNDGVGGSGDTIKGIEWVIQQHTQRKNDPNFKGSIMSMSWGIPSVTPTVDTVILSAIRMGIHVSVAAGNDGKDACTYTPSHNGGANSDVVTVGAIDSEDKVADFSNTGDCVDIYAPGVAILSSVSSADNHIDYLDGTSMACPHVTGVMAYLIGLDSGKFGTNPAALKQHLLEIARSDVLQGKRILSNGINGGSPSRFRRKWVVVDAEEGDWNVTGRASGMRF